VTAITQFPARTGPPPPVGYLGTECRAAKELSAEDMEKVAGGIIAGDQIDGPFPDVTLAAAVIV
jgi:hypothetical protein